VELTDTARRRGKGCVSLLVEVTSPVIDLSATAGPVNVSLSTQEDDS